jgi:hypothetical protein
MMDKLDLPDSSNPATRAARLARLYAEAQSRIEQVHRRGNVDPATLERRRLALADLGAQWVEARQAADAAARSAAVQAGRPVQEPLMRLQTHACRGGRKV